MASRRANDNTGRLHRKRRESGQESGPSLANPAQRRRLRGLLVEPAHAGIVFVLAGPTRAGCWLEAALIVAAAEGALPGVRAVFVDVAAISLRRATMLRIEIVGGRAAELTRVAGIVAAHDRATAEEARCGGRAVIVADAAIGLRGATVRREARGGGAAEVIRPAHVVATALLIRRGAGSVGKVWRGWAVRINVSNALLSTPSSSGRPTDGIVHAA